MTTHDHPLTLPSGIVLHPGNEPMEFDFWQAIIPTTEAGKVELTVIIEHPETPEDLDLAFIDSVIADVDHHLASGELAVHSQLAIPGIFGLEDEQREAFLANEPRALPLDQPELTFWPGTSWMIRYATVDFPACLELGIGVDFEGVEVTAVENLADAEEL